MAATLQLTEQSAPLAQTFRVTEPSGSVLTGIGLYFASAPASGDPQIPITIELRPTSESGTPSAKQYIPGTRVAASAGAIRAVASTTYSSATEYKFTFPSPVYIEGNTEVAVVITTAAQVGHYKVWHGKQGEHVAGTSQTKLISSDLNSGSLYMSSNGTSWSSDQFADLAFKVYRASFTYDHAYAYLEADALGPKALTESTLTNDFLSYPADPLIFTAGSKKVRVVHPMHGHLIGDKVKLWWDSDGYDSADTINGIPASQLIKTHTIDSADHFGYTITTTTAATNSERGGGTHMLATEQAVIDELLLSLPITTPPGTSTTTGGSLTTFQSYAGTETAYSTTSDIAIPRNKVLRLQHPHVLASTLQEAQHLSGEPSTVVKVHLKTNHKYTAPYFNINTATINARSNVIDYQQADDSDLSLRNYITTLDHTPETDPAGGTTLAKHITIPYQIEEAATSIRVYVDAVRPTETDFDVWYRTSQTSDNENLIEEQDWIKFSKTVNPPNYSNYTSLGASTSYRQYEFNVYDIAAFDQYQIKITMNSYKSTVIPFFRNLRTIATV